MWSARRAGYVERRSSSSTEACRSNPLGRTRWRCKSEAWPKSNPDILSDTSVSMFDILSVGDAETPWLKFLAKAVMSQSR